MAFSGSDDVVFAPAPGNLLALQKLLPGGGTEVWKAFKSADQFAVSADGGLAVHCAKREATIQLLRHPGPNAEEVAGAELPLRARAAQFFRLSPSGGRLAMGFRRGQENQNQKLFDVLSVPNPETGAGPETVETGGGRQFWDAGWLGETRLVVLLTAGQRRGNPGAEERIALLDASTRRMLRSVPHPSAMDVLAVAPDGRRFAEAGTDMKVRIRDAETLAVLKEFRADDGPVTALAWHPTQPIVATASDTLTIRLWDLDTGRRLQELRGPLGAPAHAGLRPGRHSPGLRRPRWRRAHPGTGVAAVGMRDRVTSRLRRVFGSGGQCNGGEQACFHGRMV